MVSNLKSAKIYIYPTDTVWGIGALYTDEGSHESICKIKRSRFEKSFSILFSDISMLKNYLDIPNELSEDWLRDFFSLETSLGFDHSRFKNDVPNWISRTQWIIVRVIKNNAIESILEHTKAPISTTSLNFTSEAPISSVKEAREFFNNLNNDDIVFLNDENIVPSSNSSTIVLYHGNFRYRILREGKYINKVKKQLSII